MAESDEKGRGMRGVVIAGAVLAAAVLGIGFKLATPEPSGPPAAQVSDTRRETRATLDPAKFQGKVRAAYVVARKMPAVIDGLYCYCHCERSFGHKSLLTCYVDDHAEHCGVCLDSVLQAGEMTREGKTIAQIRQALDVRYNKGRPPSEAESNDHDHHHDHDHGHPHG